MDNGFDVSNNVNIQIKDFIDNDNFFENITTLPEVTNDASRMYSMVINLLTGLDMEEPEASGHYYKIMEHKYLLSD